MLNALYEEFRPGVSVSNAEPVNVSTVKKIKRKKIVVDYFAYTITYVTLFLTGIIY